MNSNFMFGVSTLKTFFKNLINDEDNDDFDLKNFFRAELSLKDVTFQELCNKYFQRMLNSASKENALYTYGLSATINSSLCKKGNSLADSYFEAKEGVSGAKFATLLSSEPEFRTKNLSHLIDKYISRLFFKF